MQSAISVLKCNEGRGMYLKCHELSRPSALFGEGWEVEIQD